MDVGQGKLTVYWERIKRESLCYMHFRPFGTDFFCGFYTDGRSWPVIDWALFKTPTPSTKLKTDDRWIKCILEKRQADMTLLHVVLPFLCHWTTFKPFILFFFKKKRNMFPLASKRWLPCVNTEHVQVFNHGLKFNIGWWWISNVAQIDLEVVRVSASLRVCSIASHVWVKRSSFEKGKKETCSCSSGYESCFSNFDHSSFINVAQKIISINIYWPSCNYLCN